VDRRIQAAIGAPLQQTAALALIDSAGLLVFAFLAAATPPLPGNRGGVSGPNARTAWLLDLC
jgi:hypothetical protein